MPRSLMTRVVCLAASTLCFTGSVGYADALRIYTVGNSLTDEMSHGDFQATVAAGSDHRVVFGRNMTPGAPLQYHWEHPTTVGLAFNQQAGDGKSKGFADALDDFDWDVLTLQPYDRQLGDDYWHAARFINFLRSSGRNAKTRVYVYSQWPRRPENPATPFNYRQWWDRSYTGSWGGSAGVPDATFRTRDYFEDLVRVLRDPTTTDGIPENQRNPKLADGKFKRGSSTEVDWFTSPDAAPHTLGMPKIDLIPVGDVMYKMDELLAGMPDAQAKYGITGAADLYSDNQHLNAYGEYVVAMTWYATVFGQSPVGLPFERYADNEGGKFNADYARFVQQTAWAVVNGHTYSGVSVPEPSAMLGIGGASATMLLSRRRF